MHRRKLGPLEVSVLGLGTVKLGRNRGVKYPRAFELPDDGQVRRLFQVARDLGINLIDTAPAYGDSEERLGRLITGCRDDWLICTKAGEEFIDGVSCFDFSARAIRASIERSLRRLRVDWLDIVLLHSDGRDLANMRGGGLAVLQELKAEGLVRCIGLSSKSLEGSMASIEEMDTAMLTLTPEYREEQPAVDRAAELGKAVLVKKLLASGHAVANAQKAFEMAFAQPGVASVVVGTIDEGHLRQNARMAEFALKKI